MTNTKAQILDSARNCFNQQGLARTSIRDIAQALGISQGNLTYHFAKRSELIEGLYFSMIEELDVAYAQLSFAPLTLLSLFESQLAQGRLQEKYRFIWLDFAQIKRQHPRIEEHFQDLLRQRKEGFAQLLQGLQGAGLVQNGISEDSQTWLFEQFLVVGNFWPHAAMTFQAGEKEVYRHYARLTLSLLLPYFTAAGKEQWLQVPIGPE